MSGPVDLSPPPPDGVHTSGYVHRLDPPETPEELERMFAAALAARYRGSVSPQDALRWLALMQEGGLRR